MNAYILDKNIFGACLTIFMHNCIKLYYFDFFFIVDMYTNPP